MGSINKVEELEQEIADAGIDLIDYPFKSKRLRGITFVSKNEKIIGISNQVTDLSERLTILSEELSHIELNVGDVTSDISQEKRARFSCSFVFILYVCLQSASFALTPCLCLLLNMHRSNG